MQRAKKGVQELKNLFDASEMVTGHVLSVDGGTVAGQWRALAQKHMFSSIRSYRFNPKDNL